MDCPLWAPVRSSTIDEMGDPATSTPDMANVDRSPLDRVAMGFTIVACLVTLLYLGAEIAGGQLDPRRAQGVLAFLHQAGLVVAPPAFAALGLLIVWKAPEQPGSA